MEQKSKSICVGCGGVGTVTCKVNLGRHGCFNQTEVCPICNGTQHATEEEVEDFMRTLEGYDGYGTRVSSPKDRVEHKDILHRHKET